MLLYSAIPRGEIEIGEALKYKFSYFKEKIEYDSICEKVDHDMRRMGV